MKMLFAGALALTALFAAANFTAPAYAEEETLSESAQPRVNIARVKSVLKLTPEQQAYWPPVEKALRSLSRGSTSEAGIFKRVGSSVASFVMDSATIAKVGAAVRPLVSVLDDRQKADAIMLVREMGLGPVMAALI